MSSSSTMIVTDNEAKDFLDDFPMLSGSQIPYIMTLSQSKIFTCAQAALFVNALSFSSGKAEAIDAFVGNVTDPENADAGDIKLPMLGGSAVEEAIARLKAGEPAEDLHWEMPPIEDDGLRSQEAMARLMREIDNCGADFRGRYAVIQTECEEHPSPPFDFKQLQTIMTQVPFSSDAVKVLEHFAGPAILYPMDCEDITTIINMWLSSSDKLKILTALKLFIRDPQNKHVIMNGFPFASDKKKAEIILRDISVKALAKAQAEAKRKAEEERKQMAVAAAALQVKRQQALRRVGTCASGYPWRQVNGGYRCAAGGHYVSNAALASAMSQ